MARFILTNEQYAQYLGKEKHPVKDWTKKKDHPVVNVSWDDAMAYCKWFNQTFKSELGDLLLRLPSEAEWEKAARGAYGNEWPWGNEFDPNKCNSNEGKKGGTTPVGAYSSFGGDSPYGCADMAGNVWEWCTDWYAEDEYKKRVSAAIADPRGPQSGTSRVLRGGSFDVNYWLVRCALRSGGYPDNRNLSLGFRVCVSPSHL
jgi:formylglycine-generating enzyme required for sulfatase activity